MEERHCGASLAETAVGHGQVLEVDAGDAAVVVSTASIRFGSRGRNWIRRGPKVIEERAACPWASGLVATDAGSLRCVALAADRPRTRLSV
jgi:hypothetical protein